MKGKIPQVNMSHQRKLYFLKSIIIRRILNPITILITTIMVLINKNMFIHFTQILTRIEAKEQTCYNHVPFYASYFPSNHSYYSSHEFYNVHKRKCCFVCGNPFYNVVFK